MDKRNLFYSSLMLCCCIGFVSCSSRDITSGKIESFFTSVDSLKYDQLLCEEFLWGAPMKMISLDSKLLVFDERCDSCIFHLLDTNVTDKVLSFGVTGQGVNEFIAPFDFQFINDSVVGVYDIMKKALYSLDLNRILESDFAYPAFAKDSTPGTIKMIPTEYGSFVTWGFYDDCMYKLRLPDSSTIAGEEYPFRDNDERKIENRLRGMAYQGATRSNPQRNKLVYAVNSADIIYFYDIHPKEVKLIKKYTLNYPTYITNVDGEARSAPIPSTNTNTFISVTTTDRYVYTLYSGKNFKDSGLNAYAGNVVFVFDWQGNPVRKYNLNVDVTQICVNNEDTKLWAFANMPDPQLITFKLEGN